ncbi:MAG: tRNA 2-selenouridine(34) synthase MnmH [Bacteroidia bacterium]|jgi:tRNA 2-selenouridine synthase|nr:tRNA 2-selenouridine(34) synthase MnmH [Bacteroidia bacterium]
MPSRLLIAEFLEQAATLPVIDVRSPGEFEKGHIPGAVNIPLFSNDERAQVGTCYKQHGQQQAIDLGLEFVGPKMAGYVKQARSIAGSGAVLVHCWRGGMRSHSMAWLFETAGIPAATLTGGYKAFRNHVLAGFMLPYTMCIVGGETGSGKTEILHHIGQSGQQILDLEAIASHRGSSFGALGMAHQPTVEQFENKLYMALRVLDAGKPIWMEDESRSIGRVYVPPAFWKQMQQAHVYRIDLPLELRIKRLLRDYGNFPAAQLAEAVQRIAKRLGNADTRHALQALENGDLETVVRLTLRYYDKAYNYPYLQKPPTQVTRIQTPEDNPAANAARILKHIHNDR